MECEGVLVRSDWGSLACETGIRRENWAQCGWEVTLGEKAEISLEWEVLVKEEGHVEAALTVEGALVSEKKDGGMGGSVVLERRLGPRRWRSGCEEPGWEVAVGVKWLRGREFGGCEHGESVAY